MSREIKFRVWNGVSMEYDVIAGRFGVFYVNPGKKGDGLDEQDDASLTPFNTKYQEPCHVMQYTGLKDKNGVEIYEGDIVKFRHDYEDDFRVSSMKFKYGRFDIFEGASNSLNLDHKLYVEVIGNIYENPELLQKISRMKMIHGNEQ